MRMTFVEWCERRGTWINPMFWVSTRAKDPLRTADQWCDDYMAWSRVEAERDHAEHIERRELPHYERLRANKCAH